MTLRGAPLACAILAFTGCITGTGGAGCAPSCDAIIDGGPRSAFEPAVAGDGASFLIAADTSFTKNDTSDRWLYTHVSEDGGRTWAAHRFPADALRDCVKIVDPIVAVLSDGSVLVGGVGSGPADGEGRANTSLFLARSTDDGRSFGAPVSIAPDPAFCGNLSTQAPPLAALQPVLGLLPDGAPRAPDARAFVDKPFIATDGKRVFLSWYEVTNTSAVTRYAESDDGGASWRDLPPARQADAGAAKPLYSGAIAVAPNGNLVTAIGAFADNGGRRFLDGTYVGVLEGQRWTWRLLEPHGDAYPMIAGGDGALFVVTPRSTEDGVQTPELFRSSDSGRSWVGPVSLDLPQSSGWTVPTLAADGAGRAFSGLYHHTDGKNASEYRVATFDGGSVAEKRVSVASIGPHDLGLTLGHYMGAAGLKEGAYMVWVAGSKPHATLHGTRVG